MWADNSHSQGFIHAHAHHAFPHAPALDKLCLHSRLGCVLAGGIRSSGGGLGVVRGGGEAAVGGGRDTALGPTFLAQLQEPPPPPPANPTQVSAEAAIFVAVIVVFYAAIIVILLGTNMRRPVPLPQRAPRRSGSRSRSRSRSRHRHEAVLTDAAKGTVSTQQAQKKKRRESLRSDGAENV